MSPSNVLKVTPAASASAISGSIFGTSASRQGMSRHNAKLKGRLLARSCCSSSAQALPVRAAMASANAAATAASNVLRSLPCAQRGS
jgi:hypothetical protein